MDVKTREQIPRQLYANCICADGALANAPDGPENERRVIWPHTIERSAHAKCEYSRRKDGMIKCTGEKKAGKQPNNIVGGRISQ